MNKKATKAVHTAHINGQTIFNFAERLFETSAFLFTLFNKGIFFTFHFFCVCARFFSSCVCLFLYACTAVRLGCPVAGIRFIYLCGLLEEHTKPSQMSYKNENELKMQSIQLFAHTTFKTEFGHSYAASGSNKTETATTTKTKLKTKRKKQNWNKNVMKKIGSTNWTHWERHTSSTIHMNMYYWSHRYPIHPKVTKRNKIDMMWSRARTPNQWDKVKQETSISKLKQHHADSISKNFD